MRIIILTVCGSNAEKSPLTSARPSSFSVSIPVPFLSTALKSGKSEASAQLLALGGAGVGGGREVGGGRPCGGPPGPCGGGGPCWETWFGGKEEELLLKP